MLKSGHTGGYTRFNNSSLRISKKVRGTEREDIKRKSLSKFKKYLDLENPNHICFHTGQIIDPKNLSIDHVIK